MKQSIFIIFILLLFSCSEKYEKVPESRFVGEWEIKGEDRNMFEGIIISIQEENGNLKGRIKKLNNNKYVKMFADSNDVWISGIKRTSNYQFKLYEKKIGAPLFSLYGISTNEEFKVEFIDKNTFGLAKSNSDPKKSKLIYKRILNN